MKKSRALDQQENEGTDNTEPRLSKMSEEQAANLYEQRLVILYKKSLIEFRKNEIQRNIQKLSKGKAGNKKKGPKSISTLLYKFLTTFSASSDEKSSTHHK